MGVDLLNLSELLASIEAEMRRLGYWETTIPDACALNSTMPFCYDTLNFGQWVQFVLLERMNLVVEKRWLPPASCDISPYAEEVFEHLQQDTAGLLALIRALDALIVNSNPV